MTHTYCGFIAFCVLVFTNCSTSIQIEKQSSLPTVLNLKQQPLTIVYQSTPLSQEFMMSFKNHLLRALQSQGIDAQLETNENKKQSIYFLNIETSNERGRKLGHLTGNVQLFRAATLDVVLKNTEGVVLRKNQVRVDHVYQSELTATARKAAQKLVAQMALTD